jgi:hypothetical protein
VWPLDFSSGHPLQCLRVAEVLHLYEVVQAQPGAACVSFLRLESGFVAREQKIG